VIVADRALHVDRFRHRRPLTSRTDWRGSGATVFPFEDTCGRYRRMSRGGGGRPPSARRR
jgi:hypothetical protein